SRPKLSSAREAPPSCGVTSITDTRASRRSSLSALQPLAIAVKDPGFTSRHPFRGQWASDRRPKEYRGGSESATRTAWDRCCPKLKANATSAVRVAHGEDLQSDRCV